MLLSVDWDYYSGAADEVFDGPLWGTADHERDRLDLWRERARRRLPEADGWSVLNADFPLYGDPLELLAYRGLPTFVTWTHADAWRWLDDWPERDVVNLDSHHDLYSLSGDPGRVRPGNWAGRALEHGKVRHYTCVYPAWHEGVRVAEGFDLSRTWEEVRAATDRSLWPHMTLTRGAALPAPADVEAVLLVQSPSWTNPAHDDLLARLVRELAATPLAATLTRPWSS